MLTISNQSDYGFLFLTYLQGKSEFVPLSELIENTKMPRRFLARISALLAKHGIVQSKEGKIGGYKLMRDLKTLSLYDYLKIFEKDVAMVKCVHDDFDCPYDEICRHRDMLSHKLQDVVVKQLKKITLNQLLGLH